VAPLGLRADSVAGGEHVVRGVEDADAEETLQLAKIRDLRQDFAKRSTGRF